MKLLDVIKDRCNMNQIELDKILQYTEKGTLITVGARPAMGKRKFILNIIEQLCKKGYKCLYLSDYDKQTIIEMLLMIVASLDKQENIWQQAKKFTQAVKELNSWSLIIESTDFYEIKSLESLIQKYEPDYVFIDITLRFKNKLNPAKLKQISEQNNLKTFALLNTRREPRNKRNHYPTIKDLQDKNFVMYSDIVLLLYREEYYNCNIPKEKRNIIEIIQAKPENNLLKLEFNRYTGKIGK